jgi:hypothetical protein
MWVEWLAAVQIMTTGSFVPICKVCFLSSTVVGFIWLIGRFFAQNCQGNSFIQEERLFERKYQVYNRVTDKIRKNLYYLSKVSGRTYNKSEQLKIGTFFSKPALVVITHNIVTGLGHNKLISHDAQLNTQILRDHALRNYLI